MLRRRKIVIALLLAILIALGAMICDRMHMRSTQHANRVGLRPGCQRNEVLRIMGCEPGYHSTREYFCLGYHDYDFWQFDGYVIVILFDDDELAVDVEVFDNLVLLEDENWFHRLLIKSGIR
jgi:hypothetical protein